jgi:hypothetical protein
MLLFTKTLHVVALGLWFGSVVFFTFAALLIFQSFESLAAKPRAEQPAWLPESFTREHGTELAGLAVGTIFPWYFLLQGVCGLLTVATALALARAEPHSGVHRLRFFALALALVAVLVGWPIAQEVGKLRAARYTGERAQRAAAKADFARWHGYSLLLNFATLGLVTAAMALAARLPNPVPPRGEEAAKAPPKDGSTERQKSGAPTVPA